MLRWFGGFPHAVCFPKQPSIAEHLRWCSGQYSSYLYEECSVGKLVKDHNRFLVLLLSARLVLMRFEGILTMRHAMITTKEDTGHWSPKKNSHKTWDYKSSKLLNMKPPTVLLLFASQAPKLHSAPLLGPSHSGTPPPKRSKEGGSNHHNSGSASRGSTVFDRSTGPVRGPTRVWMLHGRRTQGYSWTVRGMVGQ